jgi:hypothetical protein
MGWLLVLNELNLFIAQRRHGINAHRPSCRKETREQRNAPERARQTDKAHGVEE